MVNTAFFARHGLNVQNQFQVNTSQATFGANIVVTNNMISIGNSIANAFINTTALFLGNTTTNVNISGTLLKVANSTGSANLDPLKLVIGICTVNASQLTIGANVSLSPGILFIGNSTANHVSNSILVQVANSTGIANLQPTQLLIGTSFVNATFIGCGANVLFTTTVFAIGNTTANMTISSVLFAIANSTGQANLDPVKLVIGTSIVNSTAHAAGANVIVETTRVFVGNSTVNATVNSTSFALNGVPISFGIGGANTQVQFNDSGVINATAGFIFNKSTNNITLANTMTAAIYDTSSDIRLKNVIINITRDLGVLRIPVWQYSLKNDETNRPIIGLIAQDVQEIIPEAVTKNNEGFLSINYDMVTAALITCVKSMAKRIEILEGNYV